MRAGTPGAKEEDPMRTISVGKLTLGLVLLAVGTAFVLQQNFGYVNAVETVARYWPLAVVALGLEFVFAARDQESRVRVSAGSILGMLLVFGIAAAFGIGGFGVYMWDGFRVPLISGIEKYTVEVPVNEPFGTGSTKLEIQAIGDITLTGAADHTVAGTASITVRARTQAEARQIAERLSVSSRPVGGTLLIEVPRPSDIPSYVSIQPSYVLSVPSTADVVGKTVSGDTRISGITGNIDVDTVSGNIYLDDLPHSLNVNVVSGDVEATLNKDMTRISINSVSGDVAIEAPEGTGGKLNFGAVSGDVESTLPGISVESKPGHKSASGTFGTGKTTVDVNTVSGDLTIR